MVRWGWSSTTIVSVYPLMLNLQALVANLKPIHLFNSRFRGYNRVVRHEPCEGNRHASKELDDKHKMPCTQ